MQPPAALGSQSPPPLAPPAPEPTAPAAAVLPAVVDHLAREFKYRRQQVENTAALFAEGCTIPFVARYRRERTGGLTDEQVEAFWERFAYYTDLEARKLTVIAAIQRQEAMTPDLLRRIETCRDKTALEDLYLPFKPHRRSRATAARERGLLPLAEFILAQKGGDLPAEAAKHVSEEKGVKSADEAVSGAQDIIAERVAHDPEIRAAARDVARAAGKLAAEVGEPDPEGKYRDHVGRTGRAVDLRAHVVLALFRGEREKKLRLTLSIPEPEISRRAVHKYVRRGGGPLADKVREAVEAGISRLLLPSVATEIRAEVKRAADIESISVFARNLEALLMAAPLGEKPVVGIDPGFRTGCKVAAVDATGKMLEHQVLFPLMPGPKRDQAKTALAGLLDRFGAETISVGNGTASRETCAFLKEFAKARPALRYVVVSEAGASVYSTSGVGREEFPDLDPAARSAVSIARRLQDPLAELVKAPPRSVGVGQYQHDVDPRLLKESLWRVVARAVNRVGVNLNTASASLLSYVAGVGPALARAIVQRRDAAGRFPSREALREVPGLGDKTFQQCAGFLRVPDGEEPLDATAVHPEWYPIARGILRDARRAPREIAANPSVLANLMAKHYVMPEAGIPTVLQVMEELKRPSRDPRGVFTPVEYAAGIERLADLKEGMVLMGVVTNVAAFGAFVDIGVHQEGLVHISQMADGFVADPSAVVHPGDRVKVRVIKVEPERKRFSLSMKGVQEAPLTVVPPPAAEGETAPGAERHADAAPDEPAATQPAPPVEESAAPVSPVEPSAAAAPPATAVAAPPAVAASVPAAVAAPVARPPPPEDSNAPKDAF